MPTGDRLGTGTASDPPAVTPAAIETDKRGRFQRSGPTRYTAVRCRFEDLDDEVRAYLNDARRLKERHPRGAYVPQEAEAPRYPTSWPLIAGALCVAVAATLCLPGV